MLKLACFEREKTNYFLGLDQSVHIKKLATNKKHTLKIKVTLSVVEIAIQLLTRHLLC